MSKTVTRTYEYDDQGRIIKETEHVVETPEIRYNPQPIWVYPQPYRYPYVTYGGSISGAGSQGGGGSVTYNVHNITAKKPEDPDPGVTAKV